MQKMSVSSPEGREFSWVPAFTIFQTANGSCSIETSIPTESTPGGAVGDSVIEFAGEGNDTVYTGLASHVLATHVENLIHNGSNAFTGIGNASANSVRGGSGDDFLSGLDGDDILIGLNGADMMLGGNGADQFCYQGGETGLDRILDFASGSDKIALSSSCFAQFGTLQLVQNGTPVANSANSTFLYNVNTGVLSYDVDGTGAVAAIQLAQLNAGLTLTVGDFIFY